MAKYEKIADDLRHKIQSGILRPGAQLPAETVLLAQYKVSLPTMRAALGVLRAEGLIEARHGLGTYVRQPRQRVRRTNTRYQWEKDRVKDSESKRRQTGATEQDTGLDVDDLEFEAEYEVTKADPTVAGILGVRPGSRVLHRTFRTRFRKEDVPFNVAHSYLPLDVVKANPKLLDAASEPWPGGTQHQLSTVGIELDRIVDEVTARPPRADEAEQLGILPGVALLVVRKISIDTGGRVVEFSEITMPGDRHELVYTTPLTRWSS